jgi:hypothetical protein
MTDEKVGAAELVEFIGAEPTASERRISAGNRSQRKGKRAARKLMAAAAAAAALVDVRSATATIHPIAVGWLSGNACGDPPRRHARPRTRIARRYGRSKQRAASPSRAPVRCLTSAFPPRSSRRPVGGPSRAGRQASPCVERPRERRRRQPQARDHGEPPINIKCALTIGAGPPVTCSATRQAHQRVAASPGTGAAPRPSSPTAPTGPGCRRPTGCCPSPVRADDPPPSDVD